MSEDSKSGSHFSEMVKKTRYQVNNEGENFTNKFTSKRTNQARRFSNDGTQPQKESSGCCNKDAGGCPDAEGSDLIENKKNDNDVIHKIRKRREASAQTDKDSISERVKRQRVDCLFLVRGYDGKFPAWHYVLVRRPLRRVFMEVAKKGSVNVKKYGDVLYSGWGEHPPQEIVDKIKEEFGG